MICNYQQEVFLVDIGMNSQFISYTYVYRKTRSYYHVPTQSEGLIPRWFNVTHDSGDCSKLADFKFHYKSTADRQLRRKEAPIQQVQFLHKRTACSEQRKSLQLSQTRHCPCKIQHFTGTRDTKNPTHDEFLVPPFQKKGFVFSARAFQEPVLLWYCVYRWRRALVDH